MTTQQLLQFNVMYLVVFVAVAVLTRAAASTHRGCLGRGGALGVVALGMIALGESRRGGTW